jgi:hypothetical protein
VKGLDSARNSRQAAEELNQATGGGRHSSFRNITSDQTQEKVPIPNSESQKFITLDKDKTPTDGMNSIQAKEQTVTAAPEKVN